MRLTRNPDNWLKRTMGEPPMSDNSQYSGSCQASRATTGSLSYTAVGVAVATQRARGRYEVRALFWLIYENLAESRHFQ